MNIENPMLNKKSSLLNIKQKIDEKSTGQEFIEPKNNEINILDLINKPKAKEEKVMLGIKLKKEVADKVKSFSYENNMTVSDVCFSWIKWRGSNGLWGKVQKEVKETKKEINILKYLSCFKVGYLNYL